MRCSPPRRQEIPPPVMEGFDFADLAARVMQLQDRENPTTAERDNVWNATCQMLQDNAGAGRDVTQTKRIIIEWLWKYGPRLAETEAALTRNLERKHQLWIKAGKVTDRRIEANRARHAPKLSQEDRKTLIQVAVHQCGGLVDFAWQTCLKEKSLSAELMARHPAPKNHHARCPKNIRKQIAAVIAQLYQHHVHPHYNSNNVAPMQRDWSNVFAQDIYELDDKTLDVICEIVTEENWKVTRRKSRCQFIPVICAKSGKVLDFDAIAEANYNSVSIRTLIKKVCLKYGLPRKIQLENGLWKTAKLLGNNAKNKPFAEIENFGTRCGVEIRHALPGRARTKIVETVFRLLDRKMYGLPGYVGSDEKRMKFERVKDAQLYTYEEWITVLEKIVEDYNNTPSNSIVKGGFLTPNEVWEKCRRRNANGEIEPVSFLTPEFEYLLAAHCAQATVRNYGVQFTLAGESYRFHSDRLIDFQAGLFGQIVKVWFDPESPETAIVTDLKEQLFIPVIRITRSPANVETQEDVRRFVEAGGPHRSFMRQVRQHYSDLNPTYLAPRRPIVADVMARESARQIGDASKQARQLSTRISTENFEEFLVRSAEYRQKMVREQEEFERQHQHHFQ
jgi:hypothetical protein